MTPFKNGGNFIAFFAFLLVMIPEAIPNPSKNLNLGSSGGGYSGGGLKLNKMIFTVQDARKLVANKMKSLGGGGGSSKKKPPPKKSKPKGQVMSYPDPHSSEKGGGYGRDHQAYSSEMNIEYHALDPHGHSNGYKRELENGIKPKVKNSNKKEVGWTPIVKNKKEQPKNKGENLAFANKNFPDITVRNNRHYYSAAEVGSASTVSERKLRKLDKKKAIQDG